MKILFLHSSRTLLRMAVLLFVGVILLSVAAVAPQVLAGAATRSVTAFSSPLSLPDENSVPSAEVAEPEPVPGWKLLYSPPVPDLFSGSVSYAYPIAVPKGRNGLQPPINLVYSSRAVDGLLDTGAIDPGPIALGWSLNLMDVVREGTYAAGDGGGHQLMNFPNQYSLLIDGTAYELQPDTPNADSGRYHAKDLPGYYIERRNELWGGGAPNISHEYWLVRRPDGTVARLGYTLNSEQATYDGVLCAAYCGTGTDPNPEDFPYSSAASRWRVDTITDTFGNVMTYSYVERFVGMTDQVHFSYEQSRPGEIDYNAIPGGWGSRIEFRHTTTTAPDGQVINAIRVFNANSLMREYRLNQGWQWNNTCGLSVGTYVVNSIQEWDGAGAAALPATTFHYQPLAHRNGGCYQFATLSRIDNGYGAATEFSYQSDGRQAGSLGQSYVVTETRTYDGLNATLARVRYAYSGRCYDQSGTPPAGSTTCTGFGRIETNGPLVGHEVVTRTVLDFNGIGLSQDVHRYYINTGNHPLRGREYNVKAFNGSHQLQAESSSYFTTTTVSQTTFTYPNQSDAGTYDGGVTATQRITYTYDNLGNLTARFEYGDPGVAGDERRTYWEYSANTNPAVWIVNKPKQESIYAGLTGALAAQTRNIYDNLPSYNSLPTKGALTRVERWNGSQWLTIAQTAYDAWGNPRVMTDALTHTTTTVYDSQYHLYPIQIVNANSQTTTMTYNMALGVVTQIADPNGAATTYSYNTFGRLLCMARPYDSDALPTIAYQYGDAYSKNGLNGLHITQTLREISGDPNAVHIIHTFYDGLGREVQTRAEASNGQQTVTNIAYDVRGQIQSSYAPAFEAVSADFSRPAGWNTRPRMQTQYDALGRTIVITNTDNTLVRTAYRGRSIGVLDANGHQRISTADAYGRVVTVSEYAHTLANVNFTTPAYAVTAYQYDTFNNLTRVTDALSNTTIITYNILSQKIAMNDPDMGVWQYAYDAAGNLTRQTDARGQRVCFTYDALNRLTGKHYRSDDNCPTLNPTLNVTYTYDSGANGLGRRTSLSDESGSTRWTYDARGRVTNLYQALGSIGLFNTGFNYDALDRVTTVYYPNGEVVTQAYNAGGQLTGQIGTNVYVSNLAYNAQGQIQQMNLGNTLVTQYAYDPLSFRLKSLQTGSLLNFQYGYDAVGNVARITDTVNSNQVLAFTYDALDRLQSAATNAAGSGQYSEGYTYNAIGNITNTNRLGNYTYAATASNCSAGTSSLKPHAVSQVVTRTFSYDCNGNMLTRNETGVLYNQTWDAENRLKVVTNTVTGEVTKFVYDGDGARALQIYSGTYTSTTAYLGNVLEIAAIGALPSMTTTIPATLTHRTYLPLMASSGVPRKQPLVNETWKMYYAVGNQVIAMRSLTITGSVLYYLHSDHLGSTSLATTASGAEIPNSRQMYSPYGELRMKGTSLPTDIGFTGQRSDATGLMYYRARYYVPTIGRFTSADLVVPNENNPQALNRYTYVFNSPIRFVDPSGHDPLDEDWIKAFEDYHHRAPKDIDRLIRLFSIAFPNEWDWSKFYTPDGNHRSPETIEKIFRSPEETRNWAAMPDILQRLASWYKPDETEAFVRDVGALFGGLPTRFVEPSTYAAVTNNSPRCPGLPCHFWAHVNKEGLEPQVTDDLDANVHHWAWSLVLGYHYRFLGVSLNSFHELSGVFNCQSGCRADLILGTRGALMGLDVSFFGHSSDALRRAWEADMYLPFW